MKKIREVLSSLRNRFLFPATHEVRQINKFNQDQLLKRLETIQLALGRIESRQVNNEISSQINDYEFQVFSQWGEDGIIHYLMSEVNIERKIFVEFGVEDYKQANTRFLLVNKNWSGLVIDGSKANVDRIKGDYIYWNYNLKAIHSFVTKNNINELLVENGLKGEIGLLSIDIDGNDYWIWDSIHVIEPAIVVIEYNHRFGCEHALTIPYDENFERSKSHYSMIYYGASLKALCNLAEEKGYLFVGCSSNGVNAFFVNAKKMPASLMEVSPNEGYFSGQFCETRNEIGVQIKRTPEEEVKLLYNLGLPLINLEDRQ